MSDDTSDIAKMAILRRYLEVSREIHENRAVLNRMQARQRELFDLVRDCQAAGRVFGFDVEKETEALYDQHAAHTSSEDHPEQQEVADDTTLPSVKVFVLNALRAAYPSHVYAAALRDQLRQHGADIHSKTVGMTLYRLSQEGLVRREGTRWYFVPKNEATPAPEDAEVDLDRDLGTAG